MHNLAPVISPHAMIGDGCEIGHGAIIYAGVEIGDDCYIGAHAIIGAPAQHHGSYPAPLDGRKYEHGVRIGSGACVREFCTVHAGVVGPTMIGDDALIMAYSHVSHDSSVGKRSTLGTASILGGFTMIDERVTFGQAVVTHPWILIGEGAMVGLNSSVVKDVLPYQKVAGAPARLLGPNTHLLGADEWSEAALDEEAWTRWSILNAAREDLRDEWARV
jgi:UDP-N-acetylglucosamine acyltransferase